jgi:GNAT superfamily N-acetyltransferase
MQIDVTVESLVHESFRVRQVAGMFDLAPQLATQGRFTAEVPGLDEPWQIGVMVGPSGSGKTTIARAAYGQAFYRPTPWPADRAVIDAFPPCPIKELVRTLTAVGLGSVPAWLRPYHVLSHGEQFRCELARAILTGGELVVFDEFTSVVDRTVARICSAAVAKALRKAIDSDAAAAAGRFVAVTCHYDVVAWLEPDWVLDMADQTLKRGRLRRPAIELQIDRVHHSAWRLFAPHHYLSGRLNKSARCYLARWCDQPVAFCALLPSLRGGRAWRISRIVVLPAYQGIGIGGRFMEAIARHHLGQGLRTSITTGHPGMIGYLKSSPCWRITRVALGGSRATPFLRRKRFRTSHGRTVVSALFRPPAQGLGP